MREILRWPIVVWNSCRNIKLAAVSARSIEINASQQRAPRRKREIERRNDGDVLECGAVPPLSMHQLAMKDARFTADAQRNPHSYLSRFDFQIFRSGPSAPYIGSLPGIGRAAILLSAFGRSDGRPRSKSQSRPSG